MKVQLLARGIHRRTRRLWISSGRCQTCFSTCASVSEAAGNLRGVCSFCARVYCTYKYIFLGDKGYLYFLLGQLTQDCVENLFAVLRLGQPLPNALIFKHHLKVVCLGMYHTLVKNSNCDFAEGEYLNYPLTVARRKAAERSSTKCALSASEKSSPTPTAKDFEFLSDLELAVMYDMAGSCLHFLMKNPKTCVVSATMPCCGGANNRTLAAPYF